MIISLKEFLLTGKFGAISKGMTKDEIIAYLGKPVEERDFGSGISCLFYNGFEFQYWTKDGELYSIQNDSIGNLFEDFGPYPINENTKVDISFLCFGKPLSFGNLKQYLTEEKIMFQIVDKDEYDEIVLESGVTFDFKNHDVNQHNDELLLNGIRYKI